MSAGSRALRRPELCLNWDSDTRTQTDTKDVLGCANTATQRDVTKTLRLRFRCEEFRKAQPFRNEKKKFMFTRQDGRNDFQAPKKVEMKNS